MFDDPSSATKSRAFLLNGQDVRAFGGRTSGDETDDAHEWDNQLYGIFAAWDPGNRIAPITQQLRSASSNGADRAGGLVSMMFNARARATNPSWANG